MFFCGHCQHISRPFRKAAKLDGCVWWPWDGGDPRFQNHVEPEQRKRNRKTAISISQQFVEDVFVGWYKNMKDFTIFNGTISRVNWNITNHFDNFASPTQIYLNYRGFDPYYSLPILGAENGLHLKHNEKERSDLVASRTWWKSIQECLEKHLKAGNFNNEFSYIIYHISEIGRIYQFYIWYNISAKKSVRTREFF